jgi:uncharacterized protein
MPTVLITGATGFIGTPLCEALYEKGYELKILSRRPDAARSKIPHAKAAEAWNAGAEPVPQSALSDVQAVVHLAGETIAGRWNPEKKKRIRESRVESTRAFVEAFSQLETKPEVFVCASAIGYYGAGGDAKLTEDSPPGDDFLADLCREWETEAKKAEALGIRVVHIRIGLVLGNGGGALEQMLPPFKMGVGGRLGNGKQWMSWVHRDDVVGIIHHAVGNAEIRGALNATAPDPVQNTEFTKTLGRVLRRPTLFPVPTFGLKVLFGEFAEFLTMSQRVVPEKTLATGYQFRYTVLESALRECLS